ncbi:MAG: two-component system response regulator CreB [Opitutaceae bacterium]
MVEDERSIADTVAYALRTEGFVSVWAATGMEAMRLLVEQSFEVVILDVGLPDIDGFELCRQIRQLSDLPIIFLTARGGEIDRVVGLEIGADDYLAKPFSPRELTARLRAVLRRGRISTTGDQDTGSIRGFHVDAHRRRIHYAGRPLDLTPSEYRLVVALVARPGRVFSREELMQLAWEDPGASMDRTVDAHIKAIRAKVRAVEPEADPIETRRGFGYALRAPE